MRRDLREVESAIESFVITQLIDNGLDTLAKRINRLQRKILAAQGENTLCTYNFKKYAVRLQQLLALACHILNEHQNDIDACIHIIQDDIHKRSASRESVPENELLLPYSSQKYKDNSRDFLPAGTLVAAKIARSHELWILARVLQFYASNFVYKVEDVESENDDILTSQKNKLPADKQRRQHFVQKAYVIPVVAKLLKADEWIMYEANERVMAMYPNTTSFYRATVQIPNPKGSPCVMLQFDDDADEFGRVPNRKVPFRFVTPLPTANAKSQS